MRRRFRFVSHGGFNFSKKNLFFFSETKTPKKKHAEKTVDDDEPKFIFKK